MAALATLPVFLGLQGKRAIVAGGTAAAAWKAELLAAAGADVHVFAIDVSAEMAAVLGRGAASGTLTLHAEPWGARHLAGAAIAIADAEDDDEAAAFHAAAREAGVPVNVIDKPAYCQFQIGAIVNRSPVVVGISTTGAAPILGQAIRRRIEALLPPALALWGRLASKIRERVGEDLSAGAARRIFWEQFVDRAFGPAPTRGETERLGAFIEALSARAQLATGHVTLVGAGPGDAELLTLKAVRALQAADVILYDDLVSDEVLELARREAKRMLVGKRGGRESCRQDDINALMVRLACQGRRVVRLKSGDPMIFGRGGEEVVQLERAGIPFEVVPGITAASAMAAALGISLTHRDHAQSVRFITGHSRAGGLPETLDWRGLADPDTTLVIYMGGRTAQALAARLMAEGLPARTPAVAVASLTRADEARWLGTLAKLPTAEILHAGPGPLLIGIGTVFARHAASLNEGGAVRAACDHVTNRPGANDTERRATVAYAAAERPPMRSMNRAMSSTPDPARTFAKT
jgi:uroporphyrin-III C-methyltransferase/precorrin-2 dehydrogenase/sirohydrochlorin ferrochelatase